MEVYLYALGLMKKYGFNSIIDIGCGSAYKLVTYLGDYETIGIEVPETYEWLISDFSTGKTLSADLIICSDIIEHLIDPYELIKFIKDISFKYLLISTPSRDLL